MIDYLSIARDLTADKPPKRIIHSQVNGEDIWIKRSVPAQNRIWHQIQRLIAKLLPYPILRATVSEGGSIALKLEAERLNEFEQKGIHVPHVLAISEDILVLNDIGPQLYEYLRKTADLDKRRAVLVEAAIALSRLHRSGMVHGRPYLRDMTWDGTKIGFLDFEENPLTVMSKAAGQARDIWIFLSAVSRFSKRVGDKYTYENHIMDVVWNAYLPANPDALNELRRFIRLIAPLINPIKKYGWRKVGSDVRRATFVTDYLRNQLKL